MMDVTATNGLATLARIGSALAADRPPAGGAADGEPGALPDAALRGHLAVHAALSAALVVQDRMLGDLLEAVDEPWLDTPDARRERVRARRAHDANVVAMAALA